MEEAIDIDIAEDELHIEIEEEPLSTTSHCVASATGSTKIKTEKRELPSHSSNRDRSESSRRKDNTAMKILEKKRSKKDKDRPRQKEKTRKSSYTDDEDDKPKILPKLSLEEALAAQGYPKAAPSTS